MTAREGNFAREHYEREPGLPEQEWYTVDEAVNYLRVSKRTIYLLLREGQLESYRVGKRGHRRFNRKDLLTLEDRTKHPSEGLAYWKV
jgi:excisionase family DNA binding protein